MSITGWRVALLGLLLGSALVQAKPAQPSVIVVGAGFSGLAAAFELQEQGWQVTVLEARPTVGGRAGVASAEWLGSAELQPVLHQYLARFKLHTQAAPEYVRAASYLIDGKLFTQAELEQQQPAVAAAILGYEQALDGLAAQLDDPLQPLASARLRGLDQLSVARWLDQLALPATARALIEQRIRSRYDEPSRLALLYLVQQSRVYRGRPTIQLRSERLPGGSQVLAQALVKQLQTLKTGARVEAVTQTADGVTVKVGAAGYHADYVILSVPLPALARISLTPALPALQQAALKDINYGWREQMLLKFRKPFWGNTRLTGEIFSNQGVGVMWIEPAPKGGANLLVNISGDNARLMKAFNDRQMVDQVLLRLDKYYPGARAAFSGFEMRRTGTDPLAGGAYLAYGPGEISRYWRLWEQPLGRLLFAGEHTDALYPGTLEGALRSGQRAAQQVEALRAATD
ncbi:flavin monoamine oxidase family protein [Pseudomonas sp. N040]|nr:flavin monoamine oxidase family protein [Pseudomonas sp. N040]MBW7013624.1 flavin monoamine oxidase family protein [Pseudomonas sp. N040]